MATPNFTPLTSDSIDEFRTMINYRLLEMNIFNDTVSVGNFIEDCRNEIEDKDFVTNFIAWWEAGQIGIRPTVSIAAPDQQTKDKMNEVIRIEIDELSEICDHELKITIDDILDWVEVNFHLVKDDVYIQDKLDEMS